MPVVNKAQGILTFFRIFNAFYSFFPLFDHLRQLVLARLQFQTYCPPRLVQREDLI